ncbi:hypothetical protein GGX14DRAFT_626851 [Mycena pura]|uniref:Uncharacterized protein n=1 Tax=Mycena pura TaxID=153505 RepID=A0AAD6YQN8_9AGAR|nr:hypothetical protein GGX14DRAFT_626851 [Mycena pura]
MSNASASVPTPEEIILTFGELMYRDNIPHSVGFVLYGIYLAFFCVYVWFTMHYTTKPLVSKILIGAMLLLFLSTTAQFIADMLLNVQQIRGYLMWTDIPLEQRRNLWLQKYEPAYILEKWPTLNFMVSDLIVIWRASVMYSRHRWWQIALWIFAFVDVVIWAYAFACTSRDAVQRSLNPTTDQHLITASLFISLGTNLLGTGLMALKGWKHIRLMEHLKWKGDVVRILLLLVETGVIWAAIQLLTCILSQIDTVALTPFDIATAVIQKSEIYFAAILPTATVIIVRLHKSFDSARPGNHEMEDRYHTSSTIRFENPTKESVPTLQ